MKKHFSIRRRLKTPRGVALIIVLAFVVLLTGLVVAFFSSSVLYRQISNSSASSAKVDLFAQGAVDTIVGDLKQEIAAGSNATFYTDPNNGNNVVGQVYRPVKAVSVVPAPALAGATPPPGTAIVSYAPNLLKRSAQGQTFFPTGSGTGYNDSNTSETISASATPSDSPPRAPTYLPSNRAVNVSTTAMSQNGRSISLARWNKPLLLPKANPNPTNDTDFTPITPASPSISAASPTPPPGTGEFVAPDWVLVARDGSNPTGAFNSNMVSSAASSIIGRYGYVIYDEGGLLDANVAGSPTGRNNLGAAIPQYAMQVAYKNVLAFADLSQLPGINALSSSRQTQVIQSLVGWRNYATAKPTSGTLAGANFNFGTTYASGSPLANFTSGMLANTNGFLRTSNSSLYNGQTDRMFASRQELMRLMLSGIAQTGTAASAVSDRANIQNSLQYLTSFSRDVNQPSYIPATFTDPANAPTVLQDGTANFGGNNAFGGDKIINPSFLEKRVTMAFTRNDGTTSSPGEPLVLRRFALNRLAWVTYLGPSANNLGAGVVNASQSQGIPASYLQQGTPENVYKHFGLTWDSTYHYWVYDHTSVAPPSTPPIPKNVGILSLEKISGREPDYFELLKAAISVGSLGKHGSLPRSGGDQGETITDSTVIQYRRDIFVDMQVFQIGANIIDQFDADNYPTRILVWNPLGTPATREIAGVENLPYLYRMRAGCVRLQEPSATDLTSVNDNKDVTKTGAVALLYYPEVWNPHDPNSSITGIDPGTKLPYANIPSVSQCKVVLNSADPDHYGREIPMDLSQNVNTYAVLPYDPKYQVPQQSPNMILSPPKTVNKADDSATRVSSMTFSVPAASASTLFREPTVLMAVNQPSANVTATFDSAEVGSYMLNGGLLSTVNAGDPIPGGGTYSASNLKATKGPFAGLMMGRAPLKYWDPDAPPKVPDPNDPSKKGATATVNALMGFVASTNGHWSMTVRLQYKDFWNNFVTYTEKAPPILDGTSTSTLVTGNTLVIEDGFDPRSARFGMMQNNGTGRPEWVFSNPSVNDFRTVTDRSLTDANNPTYLNNHDFGRGMPQTGNQGEAIAPAPGWTGVANGWRDNNITQLCPSLLIQNDPKVRPGNSLDRITMYADADGVVRRATGGFIPQDWKSLPVTASSAIVGNPLPTGNNQSRPIILNRPFRNVAELGYVFSDTPWRNLDFFAPESGNAALLDVFCINDTDSSKQLQAGKVNLNTRQESVIKAILAGAYKDEQNSATANGVLSATEAANIAQYAFTPWRNSPMAPAQNLAGFVSQWGTKTPAGNFRDYTDPSHMPPGKSYGIDGAASYSGFANEMTTVNPQTGILLTTGMFTNNLNQSVFSNQIDQSWNIQRFREAPTRALTAVGQTRVWNLMIDIIAQTGRYPTGATALKNFVVEGEQRYWVHLAIDRYTGQVVDKQVEVVKE